MLINWSILVFFQAMGIVMTYIALGAVAMYGMIVVVAFTYFHFIMLRLNEKKGLEAPKNK